MVGQVLDVGAALGVLPDPERVRHRLVGPEQVAHPLVVDLEERDLRPVGRAALLARGHPREQGLADARYQALGFLMRGQGMREVKQKKKLVLEG